MPEAGENSPDGSRATGPSPWVRVLGVAVSCLACVFVVREMIAVGLLSFTVWRDPVAWIGLLALSALYGTAGVLPAVAWVSLLNSGSWGSLASRDGVGVFARTQLLKYLPSNVLHVAGRFTSLRRRGVPHGAILRSMGLEHLLLVLVALALAAVLVLPNSDWSSAINSHLDLGRYLAIGGLALVVLLAAGAIAYNRSRLALVRDWVFDGLTPQVAVRAALLHTSFFLTAGAIAAALVRVGGGQLSAGSIAITTGTLAFAWLAGFLTPGAPGGIGVREAVLIVGLEPVLGLEMETYVAVGYRFVTVLGDLLLAGIGVGLGRRSNPS